MTTNTPNFTELDTALKELLSIVNHRDHIGCSVNVEVYEANDDNPRTFYFLIDTHNDTEPIDAEVPYDDTLFNILINDNGEGWYFGDKYLKLHTIVSLNQLQGNYCRNIIIDETLADLEAA